MQTINHITLPSKGHTVPNWGLKSHFQLRHSGPSPTQPQGTQSQSRDSVPRRHQKWSKTAIGGVKIGLKTSFLGLPVRQVAGPRPQSLEFRRFANFTPHQKKLGSVQLTEIMKISKKGRLPAEIAPKVVFWGYFWLHTGTESFQSRPSPGLAAGTQSPVPAAERRLVTHFSHCPGLCVAWARAYLIVSVSLSLQSLSTFGNLFITASHICATLSRACALRT